MCRTAQALLQTLICFAQMLVRILMTIMLMVENLIRLVLTTIYNFLSFLLQIISLLPICCVFILTSKLKFLVCGSSGSCTPNRGGPCQCIMTVIAVIIIIYVLKETGYVDRVLLYFGYKKVKK